MIKGIFTFVDLETTGMSFEYDRIIEIGMIKTVDGKVGESFSSLVNPGKRIDPFIETLTGIRQIQLEKAPNFRDIKEKVLNFLEGSVFVAHNVRFDYGFIKSEIERCGTDFHKSHLCTMRLSRMLFPEFRKHNLDSIIERFEMKCGARHRALSDAEAICQFFLKTGKMPQFRKVMNCCLKSPSIPPAVKESNIRKLPNKPGVYIFYGEKHVPLYIGKSKNIKERVLSHFSSSARSGRENRISRSVKYIESLETAGELGALFLESAMIKKMLPLYNRKLRHSRKIILLKQGETEKGYYTAYPEESERISVDEIPSILGVFKTERQVNEYLRIKAAEKNLCSMLLSLEKGKGYCFRFHLGECKGACRGMENHMKYNLRFMEAFYGDRISKWPFRGPVIISEKNGEKEEKFLIDKWCLLKKYKNGQDSDAESAYRFDMDTYKILRSFFRKGENLSSVKVLNVAADIIFS